MRRWLKKHKKESNLIFSDSMLRHLHNYFESLDENGDGSIEPEELEDPLMLFGLCQRREEVDQVLRCSLFKMQ